MMGHASNVPERHQLAVLLAAGPVLANKANGIFTLFGDSR